jgi:hypothetical protein
MLRRRRRSAPSRTVRAQGADHSDVRRGRDAHAPRSQSVQPCVADHLRLRREHRQTVFVIISSDNILKSVESLTGDGQHQYEDYMCQMKEKFLSQYTVDRHHKTCFAAHIFRGAVDVFHGAMASWLQTPERGERALCLSIRLNLSDWHKGMVQGSFGSSADELKSTESRRYKAVMESEDK